jgi:regulatory NSL complex subunit 3
MKMATTEESSTASRFIAFSHITSSEHNIVNIDHCYSKPWSSHPDASNARPLHMLFMEKFPCLSSQEKQRSTDMIDVVGLEDSTQSAANAGKARAMVSEVSSSDYADSRDDWEDHIAAVRTTWSVLQNRIFAKVIRVLQADRLARLSIQGVRGCNCTI